MDILPIPTSGHSDPLDLLKPLAAALAGEGPAVAAYPGPAGPPPGSTAPVSTAPGSTAPGSTAPVPGTIRRPSDDTVDAVDGHGIAVVVSTSGSTGTPKQTLLPAGALAASSAGTALALGGEGQWLLALPEYYVAGIQVLVRSLFAGTRPEVMDRSHGFIPAAFTAAAARMTGPIRYVSLVPTQLHRLLDDPGPQTLRVLRRFDAVLLGGSAAPAQLLAAAHDRGVRVVSTYGMSETCGGCVYDGVPLDGVRTRIVDGRVRLGGDVVAAGYLDRPELTAERFIDRDGVRWYCTDDLGVLDENGSLRLLGRADDVVISGGIKISASLVAETVRSVPGIADCFVTGIEDPEWGQHVGAAVVAQAGIGSAHAPPTEELTERLRAAVVAQLGRPAAPRTVLFLDELPMLKTGKPDRQALLYLLSQQPSGRPASAPSAKP